MSEIRTKWRPLSEHVTPFVGADGSVKRTLDVEGDRQGRRGWAVKRIRLSCF